MNFRKVKEKIYQSILILCFMVVVLFLIGFGGYVIWMYACTAVLLCVLGATSLGLGLFFLNFIRKELDKL